MAAKKKTDEVEVTGYEVAEAYKKCRSFMANCVEIPIKDGKIKVSTNQFFLDNCSIIKNSRKYAALITDTEK